jgi:hypothetical protein
MKNTGKGNPDMDHDQRIAPCGMECAKCIHFLANKNSEAMKQVQKWAAALNISAEAMVCGGCRAQAGQVPLQKRLFGDDHCCGIYDCAAKKKIGYCGFCDRSACGHRHPYAEKAGLVPSNIRPFLGL